MKQIWLVAVLVAVALSVCGTSYAKMVPTITADGAFIVTDDTPLVFIPGPVPKGLEPADALRLVMGETNVAVISDKGTRTSSFVFPLWVRGTIRYTDITVTFRNWGWVSAPAPIPRYVRGETGDEFLISLFWLWIPLGCIATMTIIHMLVETKKRKLIFFYLIVFLGVALGELASMKDPILGLVVGFLVGSLGNLLAYNPRKAISFGVWGSALAGTLTVLFAPGNFQLAAIYCGLIAATGVVSCGVAYGIGLMRDARRILPTYRLD